MTKAGLPSLVALLLALGGLTAPARGQTTAFTYQGQLKQSGSPANGTFSMTFSLFDALAAGTQQGPTLTFDGVGGNPAPVGVTSGLFTVSLDFGAAPYAANQSRWLEIAVGGTTLSPRQSLTPAPFALNTRGINVSATGQVGIGVTPTAKFQIGGTAGVDGIKFPDGTLQTSATVGASGFWSASGTNIFNNNTGTVGVGTGTPNAKLHIAGGPAWTTNGWTKSLATNNATAMEFGYGAGTTQYGIGASQSQLWFFSTPTEATGAAANYYMTANSIGNVGIGVNSPLSRLDIGAIGDGAELLRFTTERPWVFKQAYTGSGTALRLQSTVGVKQFEITGSGGTNCATFWANDADPRVGIGTTAPAGTFAVSNPTFGSLRIFDPLVGDFVVDGGPDGIFGINNVGGPGGSIDMASNYGLYVRFANTGNVGIGTSSPQAKLDVNGTTRTKVLQIMGADLAEKFPTSGEKVEPGTVMEIDPEKPGKLRMARGAYNQRVAGVVSGANDFPAGAILGHSPDSEDSPPIALSGRVWTYCDASEGPIAPGDLLTTSATPGHAMKATDRQRAYGTVIGKAMTPLAKGTGLVLVLVNLQ